MTKCNYCDEQSTTICEKDKSTAVCDSHTRVCSNCDKKICGSCIRACGLCTSILCGDDSTNCWITRCTVCATNIVCTNCGSECRHGKWVCDTCSDKYSIGCESDALVDKQFSLIFSLMVSILRMPVALINRWYHCMKYA